MNQMHKENPKTSCFEGVIIVDGLIPDDDIWSSLNDLLNDIENLPQPLPWNGFYPIKSYISVHRKMQDGSTKPPLEWIESELKSSKSCAAIAFVCEPMGKECNTDLIGLDEHHFQDLAKTFSFAANIAYPGSLNIESTVVRCSDGSFKKGAGIKHDLGEAVAYSRKTGWPSLLPIQFGLVWYWIHGNLFHLRLGDTPISRAFNAYTWLFDKRSNFPFGLVSALIGIEALYSTTTAGVGEQVRRRTQLLLGERASFKKDLDRMYAARSAFLHGSTLLSPNGYLWEPPEAIETKLEKISEAESIASAVLLSSLQRFVENGWIRLDYQEKIVGQEKEDQQSIEEDIKNFWIPQANAAEIDNFILKFIRRFD